MIEASVTVESLQQDFANLLENSFQKELIPGSVVVGEVLGFEKDKLIVDIGGKCEGSVSLREIPGCRSEEDLRSNFQVGQICDFYILREFEEDTPYVLSLKRVEQSKNWEALSHLCQERETLDVTVCMVTKGGVMVQVMGLKGFIPASQLRVAKTLEELVGEVIPAKLLEVDKNKNKLILSHREAVFEAQSERRHATLNALTEGLETAGEVVKITNFGAFVDISGIDGLLPLSEISWRRLAHPSDVLSLGQRLTVQVLTIDHERERVSLSMKRLEKDPWQSVASQFQEGNQLEVPVSKLLNLGFLAELAPGVEAFCSYRHIPREDLTIGEMRTFKIVSIASGERRITLEPSA